MRLYLWLLLGITVELSDVHVRVSALALYLSRIRFSELLGGSPCY